MLLKKIISESETINIVGNLNLDITNINSDSRKIKENGLFVAINGFTKNGTDFIPNAIENDISPIKAIRIESKSEFPVISIKLEIISNNSRIFSPTYCIYKMIYIKDWLYVKHIKPNSLV